MTWYSLNGGANSSGCCLDMEANMGCCCLHTDDEPCHCMNMVNITCMNHYSFLNQTLWNALPEGNVTIRFYASDSAGNIGFTDIIVNKQLTQEGELGILEFLTSPAGIITMSTIVGAAIGVIVVLKKEGFFKSSVKEILRIEKAIKDEEKKARGIENQPERESE